MSILPSSLNMSLRVILCGKTGLERSLRRDPSIELIRTTSALEALGELSEPIDENSPQSVVLILGPDVESQNKPLELRAAVRLINPGCRMLLAIDGQPADAGFDGAISPSGEAGDLRRVLGTAGVSSSGLMSTEKPKPKVDEALQSRVSPLGTMGFVIQSGLPSQLKSVTSQPHRAAEVPAASPTPGQVPAARIVTMPAADEPVLPRPIAPQPAAPQMLPSTLAPVAAPRPAPIPTPEPAPIHATPISAPAPAPTPAPAPAPRSSTHEGSTMDTNRFSAASLAENLLDPLSMHLNPKQPAGVGLAGQVLAEPSSIIDDRDLTGALLSGRDMLVPAVALMRQRLQAPDLAFYPPHSPAVPLQAVPVTLEGKLLGHLSSSSGSSSQLHDQAAWLAGWLVLRDVQMQIRTAALTDALTGAYNRRYLDRFLPAAVEQARAARNSLSVLMFDIDNFKQYNDQLGHAAGDEILTQVVQLLKSVVRPDDRVCRVGGDEFVVVFYEPAGPRQPASKHPSSAQQLADRFARMIATHKFPRLSQQAPGPVCISGGIATFPWDCISPAELLSKADAALLAAKRAGKNVIRVGR